MIDLRIGHGIDFHKLEEGAPFWLGGIEIPHTKGAIGHSDADVLLHAICDALLGALSLGDIGAHFPDTDPEYKGIDSKVLLKDVYMKVKDLGWSIINLDATLCLQAPKLRPHIDRMRESISDVLDVPLDCVSLKATTTEQMGFVGRQEGVEAHTVVLLHKS